MKSELSIAQSRIWFLEKLAPDTAIHNIVHSIKINGFLNFDILEQSLNYLIDRHELLKSSISSENHKPILEVNLDRKIKLNRFSLTSETGHDKEQKIETLIRKETRNPFDLKKDLLIRVTVIELENSETILLFMFHHIIMDGWSSNIFRKELSTVYKNLLEGKEANLHQLSIDYLDYIHWEKECFSKNLYKKQKNYWLDKFKDLPKKIDLPYTQTRGSKRSYDGGIVHLSIDYTNSSLLATKLHEKQFTMYHFFMASYLVLLYQYTQSTDIAIGSMAANRSISEIESVIGLFASPIAHRFNFNSNFTTLEIINLVKSETLQDLSNQNYPLEKILQDIKFKRDLSEHPIFQTMFICHQALEEKEQYAFNENPSESIDLKEMPLFLDLILTAKIKKNKIDFSFHFSKDAFDKKTIEMMAQNYAHVTEQLLEHIEKDAPIKTLRLPTSNNSQSERKNKKSNASSLNHSLLKKIDYAINSTPEKTAIRCGKESITYRTLKKNTLKLSSMLSSCNIAPNSVIGVLLEPSLELPYTILSSIFLAHTFLLIDPSTPALRLKNILADSKPSSIITTSNLMNKLPEELRSLALCLDTKDLNSPSSNQEHIQSETAEIAYILYTSGSTGKPKGVLVKSDSLLNFLESMSITPGMKPEDRLLSSTTISFDIALLEILLPIFTGSTLVLATSDERKDPRVLMNLIDELDITVMQATPTFWQSLITLGWKGKSTIRLFSGGEKISVKLANDLYPKSLEIWNLYGPTETTIWSTCSKIKKGETISIGEPISNTTLYLLGPDLHPVPHGVIGELYIGGSGLAKGYLNRPKLTKEKFIYYEDQGKKIRLYKTGDLVKKNAMGELIYIGREDSQLKIRGHRIEPGEIEQILLKKEGIIQAHISVKNSPNGEPTLVAYISTTLEQVNEKHFTKEIMQHAAEFLPNYMMPSLYVFIEQFPKTDNGKTDTKSLPEPDWTDLLSTQEHTLPKSALEETIKSIWEESFNIKPISTSENFFSIGGHSILATEIISKLSRALKKEVPLSFIFESPTIRELSKSISTLNISTIKNSALSYQEKSSDTPSQYPLLGPQKRIWVQSKLADNPAFFNVPFELELVGNFDEKKFLAALSKLVEIHPILRTSFKEEAGEAVQIVEKSTHLSPTLLKRDDFKNLEEEEEEEALLNKIKFEESSHPFDLSKAPLLRVTIVKLSKDRTKIYFVMHHLIIDGWSISLFSKDLSSLYNENFDIRKDTKISYFDFFSHHYKTLPKSTLNRQLSYWKEKLSGISDLLELSHEKPRPKTMDYKGKCEKAYISKQAIKKITSFSKEKNYTVFMVLFSLFSIVLYRYSRSKKFAIGIPVSGRHHYEARNIMGFFLNTLPIISEPNDEMSLSDFFSSMKNTILSALENQDISFDAIVRELKINRDPSYHPIFQTLFIMDNTPSPEFKFNGLDTHYQLIEREIAHHDITAILSEDDSGISIKIKYMDSIFDKPFITQLLDNFIYLCETFSDLENEKLINLSLISPEKEKYFLNYWRGDQREAHLEETFSSLFEQQVIKTPNKIAVQDAEREINYHQLNQMANYLAETLKSSLKKSDKIVIFLLDRNSNFLISMLAVFKLGLAYIPLDKSSPSGKIQSIISQFKEPFVLTEDLAQLKSRELNVRSLTLDLMQFNSSLHYPNPGKIVSPADLAYIIFTSGSTGKPKGAMVSQQGMLNHLFSKLKDLNIKHSDTIAQTASTTFDISIWQFLSGLLASAKTVILSDLEIIDSQLLIQAIKNKAITILELVPSQLSVLMEEIEASNQKEAFSSLKWLMLTGEALPTKLCKAWYALFPKIPIVNAYGPTECSDDVSHHIVYNPETYLTPAIPINGSIINTTVYLLEPSLKPCLKGMTGEIYVSGAGVGLGYYNLPQKTQEAFIKNPYDNGGSPILYKTGDLGRFRFDGSLEFLGRIDHQIKIRGFRVEIAEIEAAIESFHPVNRCIVSAVGSSENKHLIAFLDLKKKLKTSKKEIMDYLKSKLSDYAIPSKFALLDSLPLLPNGKINRSLLVDNFTDYIKTADEIIKPKNKLENELYMIWKSILGLSEFSIDHNFFELGGNSLLFLKLATMLRVKYDNSLPISLLMENITIQDQAQILSKKLIRPSSSITQIKRSNSLASLYFVPPITGLSSCYKPLADSLENISLYNINSSLSQRENSILDLARVYASEILNNKQNNPVILLGWSFGGAVALEISRLLKNKNLNVRTIMMDTYNLSSYSCNPISYNIAGNLANELEMSINQIEFDLIKSEIEHNTLLFKQYNPEPYNSEVLLLRATVPENGDDDFKSKKYYGWKNIISPDPLLFDIGTQHTTMLSSKNINELAKIINKYIQLSEKEWSTEKIEEPLI